MSIIGENGGPRSRTKVSGDKAWLKTSNSSSESATSTTSSSSVLIGRDEVAAPVVCCVDGASTFGIPSKMGVMACTPSGFGPGRRKLGVATLILCRHRSFALIMHLGARKVLEIGV